MNEASKQTCFHVARLAIVGLAVTLGAIPQDGWAARRAATSVHRPPAHATARPAVSRPQQAVRPGQGGSGTRSINTNNSGNRVINKGGDRINTGDINIDVDHDWDDNGWDHHPVAAGVAFGTAAAITSAAIGSMIYSLPPSCVTVTTYGPAYYRCGSVWYQPQYAGSSVTYVVVNPPG